MARLGAVSSLVRLSRTFRKRAAVFFIVIALVSATTLSLLAFTAFGRPAGTCPPIRWAPGHDTKGSIPFKIVDTYEVPLSAPGGPYGGSGTVSWCLYGNDGFLKAVYPTNRLLGEVEGSGDGSSIAASGWKIGAGRAAIYQDGAVYLFDRDGRILWNFTSSNVIFSVGLNTNGSIILANGPELFYFNHEGTLLWSNSTFETFAAQLAHDGAEVVAGVNHLNGGCEVVMYDSKGKVLWNRSLDESSTFSSSRSIAVSDTHIAAGTSVSGYDGTLYYTDLLSNIVWSRHVDSAVSAVYFVNNDSEISVQTNWGTLRFDLNGNLIST